MNGFNSHSLRHNADPYVNGEEIFYETRCDANLVKALSRKDIRPSQGVWRVLVEGVLLITNLLFIWPKSGGGIKYF